MTRRLAIFHWDILSFWPTVASFQNITEFFVFISNTFFTVLVSLCRFMPGVLTPIFARREGRGLSATDIITFS